MLSSTNRTFGPEIAPVMLVLPAPTEEELREGSPGITRRNKEDKVAWLFRGMLEEAGLDPALLHIAYVLGSPCIKPHSHYSKTSKHIKNCGFTHKIDGIGVSDALLEGMERLNNTINQIGPKRVVAVGDLPLFALTHLYNAKEGAEVRKWRGSEIYVPGLDTTVVPIHESKAIFDNWPLRYITVHDLKVRVAQKLTIRQGVPPYDFLVEPTLVQIRDWLEGVEDGQLLACDIETVKMSLIDCIGFATSPTRAICIPLTNKDGTTYWHNGELEEVILPLITRTCARVRLIGQNFNYDSQYLKRTLNILARPHWDTLTAQHVLFPGTPKSLDYLASLWCDHYIYWKDENKNWTGKEKVDNKQRWTYNCTDCCRTFEIALGQMEVIKQLGFEEQMEEQLWTDECCFRTMLRGVRVNKDMKAVLSQEVKEAIKAREQRLNEIAGYEVNPRSPAQVKGMFHALGFKIPTKQGKETTDKEALEKLTEKEGTLGEVANLLLEIRSLGTLSSNVINAKLGPGGRFYTSFNSNGAETYRLSSSKSAFGEGGNAQNITDGSRGKTEMPVPNLRKLDIPDPGCIMFEGDLQRADVQVVAWEADDAILKQMFREGADLHTENAKALFGLSGTPSKPQRDKGKTFVHLTNYGGKARTCATKCGITVAEAERLQKRWFDIHPGILEWHKRIEKQLKETRSIRNAFGYRRYYFDRLDGLLPQALAWIPQSTVALVINRAWKKVEQWVERRMKVEGVTLEEVMILMQVHDSLMGQFLEEIKEEAMRVLAEAVGGIVVPYPDPLIIGVDFKFSRTSWGDCKPLEKSDV